MIPCDSVGQSLRGLEHARGVRTASQQPLSRELRTNPVARSPIPATTFHPWWRLNHGAGRFTRGAGEVDAVAVRLTLP